MEKRSILLVEDDDVVRDLIRGTIEREYNVIEASNCSEGIEHLSRPIDIALIDYLLPDGNGFDIIDAIKEMKPAIPVIMMTGYSTEELAIKACGKGVVYYMRKPETLGCLRGKLLEILEGKKKEDCPDSVGSHETFIMDYIALLIEDNYMEDFTRDELAEKAHMSSREFSMAFSERFGMGVKLYINNVRVRKAVELINKNHDMSITNIAFSVGYRNLTHFERVFRKICGSSPGEFKRNRSDRPF